MRYALSLAVALVGAAHIVAGNLWWGSGLLVVAAASAVATLDAQRRGARREIPRPRTPEVVRVRQTEPN